MYRVCFIVSFMILVLCATALPIAAAPQEPSGNALVDSTKIAVLSTLKISLRLEDETPFLGAATVRLLPEQGYELLGARDEAKGNVLFYAVAAGKYSVDVSAPGFQPVRFSTEMESGGRERVIFVMLKRRTLPSNDTRSAAPPPAQAESQLPAATLTKADVPAKEKPATTHEPAKETPKAVAWGDEGILDATVACPTDQVLQIAGDQVQQFIRSLEEFTALETVEHYNIDKSGNRKERDVRKFPYVVIVTHDPMGWFGLEEFRNGSTDKDQFPAHIATTGLPAVVLVFHPEYAVDFEFSCEGLVRYRDHEFWQMHFAQRKDRPVRIESYVVNGASYSVYLQGRAWIEPGKGQVVRLESELEKPVPEIQLWQQNQKIDYIGVRFTSINQEVWLPHTAEVYVERHGRRFYRRHSFEDFRLFNVDTAQNVKSPKGSYSFTNVTDSDVKGELTVVPVEGISGGPIILRFALPPHKTVIKTVGAGKDVNLPAAEVGSAKFVHSGDAGSVKVDVDLVQETTLDVIPEKPTEHP
jgi:hypothetical protein